MSCKKEKREKREEIIIGQHGNVELGNIKMKREEECKNLIIFP
jgi:hypothetical protein